MFGVVAALIFVFLFQFRVVRGQRKFCTKTGILYRSLLAIHDMKIPAKQFALLFFWVFAFAVGEASSAAKPEPMPLSGAINKAGRQRMLTQRIVKAYCQLGLRVQPDKSRVILEKSVSLFDAQLAELRQYSFTPDIQDALAKEAALWGEFRAIALAPVSHDGAKKLMEQNEALLQAAHKATMLLESASGTKSGKLVNLAGRQRMLSQRLAKFYMLRRWGFSQPEIASGIEQAQNEFGGALQTLADAPGKTMQIQQELDLAKIQWIFFKNALTQHDSGADLMYASNVATSSEHILELMDDIAALYEKSDGS